MYDWQTGLTACQHVLGYFMPAFMESPTLYIYIYIFR